MSCRGLVDTALDQRGEHHRHDKGKQRSSDQHASSAGVHQVRLRGVLAAPLIAWRNIRQITADR